jgi:hypothetical protein
MGKKNLVVLSREEIDELYDWEPVGKPTYGYEDDIPEDADALMIIKSWKTYNHAKKLDFFSGECEYMYELKTNIWTGEKEWVPVIEEITHYVYQPIKILGFKKFPRELREK